VHDEIGTNIHFNNDKQTMARPKLTV